MRYILSLCKSHIYELHAILAGTITFFSMFIIKKPLKYEIDDSALSDTEESKKSKYRLELKAKRVNALIVFETMMVGMIMYFIVDFFSPLVNYSVKTAILTGVVALVEYAVYEQFATKRRGLSK